MTRNKQDRAGFRLFMGTIWVLCSILAKAEARASGCPQIRAPSASASNSHDLEMARFINVAAIGASSMSKMVKIGIYGRLLGRLAL